MGVVTESSPTPTAGVAHCPAARQLACVGCQMRSSSLNSQQELLSSRRQLACVRGHPQPTSINSQQELPSSHRWLACVRSHLQPSSLSSQQELPSSHRWLSCVRGHPRGHQDAPQPPSLKHRGQQIFPGCSPPSGGSLLSATRFSTSLRPHAGGPSLLVSAGWILRSWKLRERSLRRWRPKASSEDSTGAGHPLFTWWRKQMVSGGHVVTTDFSTWPPNQTSTRPHTWRICLHV